jgi:hypothetical protein
MAPFQRSPWYLYFLKLKDVKTILSFIFGTMLVSILVGRAVMLFFYVGVVRGGGESVALELFSESFDLVHIYYGTEIKLLKVLAAAIFLVEVFEVEIGRRII